MMKRQHQAPTTNSPASGTGTSTHYHAQTYNLAHHHNLTHGHQLTISTFNPLYMFKHQPSWLMDHNSSLTYSNPLQHQLYKLTNPLTIICDNNKPIHCLHCPNHLTHIYHNHSTHKSHHCISYNTHLVIAHLWVVLTLLFW